MRRLLVLLLACLLVVPPAAVAFKYAPGDGTLSVRGGEGIVRLDLRGAIIGRLGHGTLVVVDPEEGDCDSLLVWDADTESSRLVSGDLGQKRFACFFRGSNIRFRFVGGQNEIRLNGRGIFVSAVGRGTVYLQGSRLVENDGTFSINSAPPLTLPDNGDRFRIAASA